MHNSYIEEYVNTPVINDDKLVILTSILNNTELTESKKKNYIISTMLVQMALDTHDLVPKTNSPQQSNADKKTKQLSVLAGDYYSGLYYLLLSEVEDVEMVHILATAIKEINECKMQLYYGVIDSFETFVTIVKKIESLLFVRVAEFVGELTVSNVAAEWLLTRKLKEERNHLIHRDSSRLFTIWFKQTSSCHNPETIRSAECFIQKETTFIESCLSRFPEHLTLLRTHMKYTLNEFSYNKRSIVEEG